MIKMSYAVVLLAMYHAELRADAPCKFHVTVVSISNDPIPADLEFVDLLEDGIEPKRFTLPGKLLSLPQSLYRLHVTAKGFANRTLIVNVTGAETYLRIGLNVSRLGDEDKRPLSGKVRFDTPTRRAVWVRLVPVLNQQEQMEMPLSREGSFIFEDLAPGEYILLVLEDSTLLHSEQVSCFGKTDVRIQVKRSHQK